MKITTSLISACFLLALISLSGCTKDSGPEISKKTDDSKFKPGQVWKYETRKHEPDSRITILGIDNTKSNGTVVHITIDDLVHEQADSQKKTSYSLSFISISRASLNQSVVELEETLDEIPNPEKYKTIHESWVTAFEGGVKVVFNQSIVDAILSREVKFDTENAQFKQAEMERNAKIEQERKEMEALKAGEVKE